MKRSHIFFTALLALLSFSLAIVLAFVSEPLLANQIPIKQATEKEIGQLEIVATFNGPMPTGVTVSQEERVFVNFPRWGDDVPFTVAEIKNGQARAYPNVKINKVNGDPARQFISVQSVVVDPVNRLWVLDTGRVEHAEPAPNGPKLVAIDLASDQVVKTILFPRNLVRSTSYLNDVRFDLRRGREGFAYITDSSSDGDNGLIVVDIATKRSWRRLDRHPSTLAESNFIPIVEGQPILNQPRGEKSRYMSVGSDGIALSSDGESLFYRPLSGRHLYSVSLDALCDRRRSDREVASTIKDYGDLGFASDGLESDQSGRIYLTNYEDNGILTWMSDGTLETLVHNRSALWPDTLALASNGYLYFTANQLHRQPGFHHGVDLREKPYILYRVRVDRQPVKLK